MRKHWGVFLSLVSGGLAVTGALAAAGSATYIYDSAGRVRGAVYEDGSVQSYRYDPAGNRLETATTALSGVSILSAASVAEGGRCCTLEMSRAPSVVRPGSSEGAGDMPTIEILNPKVKALDKICCPQGE